MASPADEKGQPQFPAMVPQNSSNDRYSDEEGTVVGDHNTPNGAEASAKRPQDEAIRKHSHLTLETEQDYDPGDPLRNLQSPSQSREESHRLQDDLEMLKVERQISRIAEQQSLERTESGIMGRSASRREDVDEFDIATNPIHEQTQVYKPPEHPTNKFALFFTKLHKSSWLIRNVFYILPMLLILLVPLLLGALVFKQASVGGVKMTWFFIWLEVVWLTLFAGRLVARSLPWPVGVLATLFTNNAKKWRDMVKQLEWPATLFFWWLAIEISFLPTMKNHEIDGSHETKPWMGTMNKVLVSFFVGAILNFIEKIIIQLIAISFHLRTYADRIEINKFQIGSLVKLYTFSKEKIMMEDSEFEAPSAPSGARTPGALLNDAQKQTKNAVNKFGDVAGKIAGDFTGRAIKESTHPHQVVLTLLNSTGGSQVLARRLYRTFARDETQTVYQDELTNAFENEDEATAAFSMFDKDMNGDISMEELEAVCVEIGRERKSITASLKDLDSVVSKLDSIFMFIVLIVVILVFISLISTSAAGVLTSAGSSVLALSWLFSATAQEFLQSVIFVFVKHPFDVGDRITVYGNTGTLGRGDDYFVKEISLLYCEFKKMEGHVVQAPNSYLNTLFILNQRRSGGVAEAVSITVKFGTTLDQIEGLRNRLLEFVKQEKREYQGNILTELRDVVEAHSININVVFFYKSNWQNEGLRLARRNKFICAMMVTMQELGIEGPRMRYPGQKESFPVYLQQIPHVGTPGTGHGGHPDNPTGWNQEEQQHDPPFVAPPTGQQGAALSDSFTRQTSVRGHSSVRRPRAESLAQMNRRVDFSLGMKNLAANDVGGDVYEDRSRSHIPIEITEASRSRERASERASQERHSQDIGRSSSIASRTGFGGLARRSTDTDRSRVPQHRNRFFGRHRAGTTADEQYLMENGMADIPEATSESPAAGGSSSSRMDPRTGMVSPAAWRMNTNESNLRPQETSHSYQSGVADAPSVPPMRSASGLNDVGSPDGYRRVTHGQKSATEDFEMRRFR